MDTVDLFSGLSRAISQSEQRRRREEITRFQSSQRERLVRGFFEQLIVSIPAVYKPHRLLFIAISSNDIVCYEQPFELAADLKLIFSVSRGEGSSTSFAPIDSANVTELRNELSRMVATSPGRFHLFNLDWSHRTSRSALQDMLRESLDQDAELLVVGLNHEESLANEQSTVEEVTRAALTGHLVFVWPLRERSSFIRSDHLTDLVARIRRAHQQYIESIVTVLSTSDRIQIAVEAANRRTVEEAIRLESTITGVRMTLHKISNLTEVAATLVHAFPDSDAVAAAEEFYQGYIRDLKESCDRVRNLRKKLRSPEGRLAEFASAGNLLDGLRRVFRQLCAAGHATGIELQVLPEERLLAQQVVAPPRALTEELFVLQLDNCIEAIKRSGLEERVIQVELIDGADLLSVAITNFAEKAPQDRLEAIQRGQVVRGTTGGWGMLLSRQILGEVGGRVQFDSPISGEIGTRVSLGFRKVFHSAESTGGY